MSEAVNYYKYTQRIKAFIDYVLEKYFDDGPGNLREILKDAGLVDFYPKFYSYLKRENNFSQLINYETLLQFSLLDPDMRTPLEIRAHLLGEDLPDYNSMEKPQLLEMLIDARNRSNLVRMRSHDSTEEE